MNLNDLPTAPVINGLQLRREAYRALNSARIQHDISGGSAEVGKGLREFFLSLAELCPQPSKKETPK